MNQSFFNLDYNPKIDYLISKDLMFTWPKRFNEFNLRRAFNKNVGSFNKDLKILIKIRDFLRKNSISNLNVKKYEKLVTLISGCKYLYIQNSI